ncbi:hypothetical protein MKQ70_37035 [Chitinophaga sedimenti]|uniref:hypothetical protein n=1 Tax=Chitinophaga sedimenti TaxID=2033606 RepID=UPI002002FE1D|nr:hypothetical protein [Chitinophaga sedimenti]MCK7560217.1 hypothetical protein [Chitinophaga sedimenti]
MNQPWKPILSGTEVIKADNANRCFLLQLDESIEQDERVMDYQRKLSAGKINVATEQQARTLLQHVQRVLHPVIVRNPYAEQLKIRGKCSGSGAPMRITCLL